MLRQPFPLECIHLTPNLIGVDQLATLGLRKGFLNLSDNGAAFVFGPIVFESLRFECATENVLGVGIFARGKTLFD